ncbi:hypothetical protein BB560_005295, partial [Smittium megazygosporum]
QPPPVLMKNYELSKDGNLLEYFSKFEKAGYVAKFIGAESEFVTGKPHLLLFSGLPENALSKLKVVQKSFHKNWSVQSHFKSENLRSILKLIVYTNIPFVLHQFEHVIHENINKDILLFLENDYVFIENIFEYIRQILIDMAIRHCYGEKAKSNPIFVNNILLLLNQKVSYRGKHMSKKLKFRQSNSDISREYLSNFVINGEYKNLNSNIMDENDSIVNTILKNQKEFDIPNDIFYSTIPSYITLFVILLEHAFSSFLIDISLCPRVFKKLANEQRRIMDNHGKIISTEHLDKMAYLDAAIVESFRLSNSQTFMKQASCDIFLPNGVLLHKGSFVKFNCVTYDRSPELFKDYPHDFIPERHFKLGTKLDVTSKTNLIWGFG